MNILAMGREEKRVNPVEKGGPVSWVLLALFHQTRVQASLVSHFKKSGEPFWKDRKGAVVLSPVQLLFSVLWSLLTLNEIQDNRQFLHLFVLSPKPGNLTNSSVLRSINTCFNFSINFGKNADIGGLVVLIFIENLPNSLYTSILYQLSVLGKYLPCIEKLVLYFIYLLLLHLSSSPLKRCRS